MHFKKSLPVASALLLSALPYVMADDIFDRDEVPRACATICEPIRQLVRQCDVDDDRVGGDRNEDLLERQCVCENTSFDVANVAGQCQSCIEENWRGGCDSDSDSDSDDDSDDDDCDDAREDINELVRACGFSSVPFNPDASPTATPSADKPTDVAQLTTTVNPKETSADIGGTGGNQDSNRDESNRDDDNRDDDTDDDSDDGSDDTSAAGKGATPGMLVLAGAAISGAWMLQ